MIRNAWRGVYSAITTKLDTAEEVDLRVTLDMVEGAVQLEAEAQLAELLAPEQIEGVLLVRKAGEMLYHLRERPAWAREM